MRRSFTTRSGQIALGGILAAGSLAVLYLTSTLSVWRMGLTALAGLFPMVGVLAAGHTAGLLCWITAGVLALLLVPDKGAALLYLLFFGCYPVAKEKIEGLRQMIVEWSLKAVFFNLILSIFWFFLRAMFLLHPPVWLEEHTGLLYLLGNLVFISYDFALSRIIAQLRSRLRLL